MFSYDTCITRCSEQRCKPLRGISQNRFQFFTTMIKGFKNTCKSVPFSVSFNVNTFEDIFQGLQSQLQTCYYLASCRTLISVKQLSVAASLNRIHVFTKSNFIDVFYKTGALQPSRSLKNTCERVHFFINLQAGSM